MNDDITPLDLELFIDELYRNTGIPRKYLSGTTNADLLERIMRRRKRLKNLKDIFQW